MSSIQLPEDLKLQALTKFDALVSQGRLFFEQTESEIVKDNGFKVNGHGPYPFTSFVLFSFSLPSPVG